MLNVPQIEFRLLFDRIGDTCTISGLPKILLYEKKKKNALIRMLYQQLELISV